MSIKIKPLLRVKTVITTLFHCHSGRSTLPNNAHFQRFNYTMAMPSDLNFNLYTLCREGRLKEALHILLTKHNPPVNCNTYFHLLQTCISKKALSEGKQIHSLINHREFKFATFKLLQDTLIRMYENCGCLVDARQVFDQMAERDLFSWNIIIVAYRRHGYPHEALTLFHQMQPTGVQPDHFTFASILPACAKIGDLKQGMDIHQSISEKGLLSNVVVANALVDMYAKCGSIHKARELFDKMHERNAVSWNSMIAGYVQNGFVEKAVEAFKHLQLSGIKPDSATFASVLPACAKMGALELGTDIHQNVVESGFLSNVVVTSALVDMYAKCGSIHKARELFNKMTQRNVISWNAMIAGYAQNGFCKGALKLFELMKLSGTYPDHVSFLCVLFACSHAGLVDEGCKYFNCMSDFYCITPIIDHYLCMVDLLGRAGYLEESLNFIIKIPTKPVVVMWRCLLGACRSHKNVGLGVFTATLLFELDPNNSATYVLLSNIYAEMGRWGEVQKVRKLMKDRGIKKTPGCSWIEGHKMVHAFCVGDTACPQT